MKNLSITIFVTMSCNLRCTYCYEQNDIRNGDMSFETADKVILFIKKKIKEAGTERLVIRFHGGEPLIAFDLIKYLMDRLDCECGGLVQSIHYSLTTNLTLYKSYMAETMKRFSMVSVSIDGTQENHDRNRIYIDGTGTYNRVKNSIEKLLNDGISIVGRITVTKDNYKDIDVHVKSIIDIGIDTIDMQLDLTEIKWMNIDIELYLEKLKVLLDYSVFLRDSEQRNIEIPMFKSAKNKLKNSICDGGISSFAIATDGLLYPCIMATNKEEYILGDVEGNIKQRTLDTIQKIGLETIKDCEGCARYDYCSTTRCRIINKICTGDYFTAIPANCLHENLCVRMGKM